MSVSCVAGEGNGNPLQYSCLDNPTDRGSLVGCRLWGLTELDMIEVNLAAAAAAPVLQTTSCTAGRFFTTESSGIPIINVY